MAATRRPYVGYRRRTFMFQLTCSFTTSSMCPQKTLEVARLEGRAEGSVTRDAGWVELDLSEQGVAYVDASVL